MRRYIQSFSTRSNIRNTDALRDQFIRQLTEESTKILAQLSQQFTQDLQTQATQVLQNAFAQQSSTATPTGTGDYSSAANLLSLGTRYLLSRPQQSHSSRETSRSQFEEEQFRLSRNQALAEATTSLGNGEKNQ